METSVANAPPSVEEPVTPASIPSAVDPQDPFAFDEAKLASFSPEQREALKPVFEEWKTKAKSEIEKTGKTYEEKYKPHTEKSEALDQLVKDPRFQTWWKSVQETAAGQNPAGAEAAKSSKPQDFASEHEWQQAWQDAYAGDYTKFKEIQARMFSVMATPVIQQLKQGQHELRQTLEMKDLLERHADAKELDLIGRDPMDKKGESLLESCLDWAERNGKTLEDGYLRARKWADALQVNAQKQAMGMVQSKKDSVTSGPSTNKSSQAVVEVNDAEELMAKNMEYLASGQTPPKFVIRNSQKQPQWSQRN